MQQEQQSILSKFIYQYHSLWVSNFKFALGSVLLHMQCTVHVNDDQDTYSRFIRSYS